jgi:PAS domain S-box-containing protein
MRLSTRWNILLLTVLPITVIYLGIFAFSIVQMQRQARRDVEDRVTELAGRFAAELDADLREVAQVAVSTATFVETRPDVTEEQVYAQLRANVARRNLVYGSAMAFEPETFEGRPLCCPYVYRDGEGFTQLDIGIESYDYTQPEWQWYCAPRDEKRSLWTEPYFDEGAGNILMCTYSVPFNRQDQFWGVTTIDIPLTPLNQEISAQRAEELDFYVVSGTGQFVYHPDPDRIMKDTVFEVAERYDDQELSNLAKRITSGESGVTRMVDWETGERVWYFHAPIRSAGWGFAARITEAEAMADANAQIAMTAATLLLSLLLIFASIWFVSGLIARAQERVRLQGAALESAANAIVITDAHGEISWVNPAFTTLTGYERDEAIGANPRVLKSGKHTSDFYRDMWETVLAGRIWHDELVNRRKDGSLYDEEMTITPVVEGDSGISHFVAIKQDVSLRKRAEEELRTAREVAEEANRSKSAFLANMSHEIRTPMNGIMGMTDLALDTDLTSEQREYMTTVKSSAESLLTLLNDILDFSKIEAGKLELDPVDFELRNGLADTLNTLAVRAHSKRLELACHVESNVPDVLVGDVHRLRQIIVNLVGNAIKFTEEGEVVVHVSLQSEVNGDVQLRFSVEDTGIGIPQEKLSRIFTPFEQADTSTTRRFGGTGLGLAISAQLVELMGGRIWAESEPGQGSRFLFTSRFGRGRARTLRTVEIRLGDLMGKPILVVDDNKTNRKILEEMLKNWRMAPTVVDNAQDALRALDQARNAGKAIELIISDVNMPDMDGFEFAAKVKENALHSGTRIILLTSASRSGDSARCRELGVYSHLMKPVKQSALLDAIVGAVGGAVVEDRPSKSRAKQEPLEEPTLKPLKVLLAEDNPVNQKFALRVLQKGGHTVELANNGREALESWQQASCDVILMDVQMPEMDGFEATARIRERESGADRRTPIIAMTAHAMKGDRQRCLEAGMDGYVTKPIKASVMFAEIERVLESLQ